MMIFCTKKKRVSHPKTVHFVCKNNTLFSLLPISQHCPSTQMGWRVFSCLTQTQPHNSSSWSLTYLINVWQFFQTYSLYCCYFNAEWILMFCLYAVLLYPVLLCFALLCCYHVLCSRNEARNKEQNCQYYYWKALWYESVETEGSWFVANIV